MFAKVFFFFLECIIFDRSETRTRVRVYTHCSPSVRLYCMLSRSHADAGYAVYNVLACHHLLISTKHNIVKVPADWLDYRQTDQQCYVFTMAKKSDDSKFSNYRTETKPQNGTSCPNTISDLLVVSNLSITF